MKTEHLNYGGADVIKFRKQIVKEINDDKDFIAHLKTLNVSKTLIENNASFIYDYLEARRSVAACVAAGKCLEENHFHDLKLLIDGNFITTDIAVCPVYVKEQAIYTRFVIKDVAVESLKLRLSDLVERASFNPFRSEFLRLIKNERDGVFVTAKHNIGIQEECAAFLMQVLRENKNVVVGILNLPRLVAEFAGDIYNNKIELDNRLNTLAEIDYLVIDELGNEESNNLIRDLIIFPLVNNRVKAGKRTVFLSELTLEELQKLYIPNSQSVRGQQIIRLIKNSIEREIKVHGTVL